MEKFAYFGLCLFGFGYVFWSQGEFRGHFIVALAYAAFLILMGVAFIYLTENKRKVSHEVEKILL